MEEEEDGGVEGRSWNAGVQRLTRVGLSPPELGHWGCGGQANVGVEPAAETVDV